MEKKAMGILITTKGNYRRGKLKGYDWKLFKDDDGGIWTDDTVLTS